MYSDSEASDRVSGNRGTSDSVHMDVKDRNEGIRLNRFIADSGLCSRRKADELIGQGRIYINGAPAVVGTRVFPEDTVTYEGRPLTRAEENVLLLFNKPAGIVCTAEKREKDNIVDYINYPVRIYPIGRLDRASTGLILLTNHGDFFNDIMKARAFHEKEYVVSVDRPFPDDFVVKMAEGVFLHELGVRTRPCTVTRSGAREFHIILTQGLNRQIRRMTAELGYRVVSLQRIRIMNLLLGDLPVGKYRQITEVEKAELERGLGRKLWD